MLCKMIYFSRHKFAFLNLRFFAILRTFSSITQKYAFKLKIKYIMLISSLSPIWWCTYISLFLKKTTPPTPHTPTTPHTPPNPLHWTIQNILLAPNPFHCFFAKSFWAGKKLFIISQELRVYSNAYKYVCKIVKFSNYILFNNFTIQSNTW